MSKKFLGPVVIGITAFASFLIILLIVLVIVNIISDGMETFTFKFLTEAPSEGMTAGGIFPAIVGTFFRVMIMTLVGVPIGTITAIYLSEYASSTSRFAQMIRFAVNTLAGVPAIVFVYSVLVFLFNLLDGVWIQCLARMANSDGVSPVFYGQA